MRSRSLARVAITLLAIAANPDDASAAVPATSVAVVSDRTLRIAVPGLDPAGCCDDLREFVVEPAATPGKGRIPVQMVGVDRQVTDLPAAPAPAVVTTRIHLQLEQPLAAGRPYRVTVRSLAIGAEVRFDADARSPAIAVNQLGYAPGARKVALVGDWLGTAGPLPIVAKEFEVLDTSGKVAWRGPLALRERADPWSGNDVYAADFSTFERPGRYRVRVAGIGASDEFAIRNDAYDAAYRTVMRVFYHQRNSTAIDARHAVLGYARPGGVPTQLDAIFDTSATQSPPGRGRPRGEYRSVQRGWFDAGDYGQYVPNAAPVWFCVGLGLDLAPDRFRDGDLGIPESGNQLPDVLDELEWGFDWLLSMQDPRDGGVHFRVASERWDDGMPQQVRRPRLIAEKTTHATSSFAAAAAIHARLFGTSRPERAAVALAAARHAWQFVSDHPQWPAEGTRYRNRPGMHAGEYSDLSALDNRMWAAAELLRATGEPQFLEFFESNFAKMKLDPTGEVTYSEQGMAAVWAYLRSDNPKRDPAIVSAARKAVIAGADWRIRQMEANAWLAPAHPRRSLTGWGNFAQSARAALTLLQAQQLTGDRRYLDWAWMTPAPQLGLNPQGLSYVTGLGARSPRHPLSKLSQYSDAKSPLPGLPVNGPHARLPGTWPTTRLVTAAYWPAAQDDGQDAAGGDGYPVLRRYTDSDQLPPMSEPTVAEVARVGIAFGLLRDGSVL